MDEISFLKGFSNIIIRLFHADFKKIMESNQKYKTGFWVGLVIKVATFKMFNGFCVSILKC